MKISLQNYMQLSQVQCRKVEISKPKNATISFEANLTPFKPHDSDEDKVARALLGNYLRWKSQKAKKPKTKKPKVQKPKAPKSGKSEE